MLGKRRSGHRHLKGHREKLSNVLLAGKFLSIWTLEETHETVEKYSGVIYVKQVQVSPKI